MLILILPAPGHTFENIKRTLYFNLPSLRRRYCADSIRAQSMTGYLNHGKWKEGKERVLRLMGMNKCPEENMRPKCLPYQEGQIQGNLANYPAGQDHHQCAPTENMTGLAHPG